MTKWTKIVMTGATVSLLCACDEAAESKALKGATHGAHFAVVSTNYDGATSISLLDDEGNITDDEYLGARTKKAELRTPLAEDVVLPSTSFSRRYLTTIERGLGVVTRFDLNDGVVLGQIRTDQSPDDDEAAFHSNPQDVFYANETSAWVSRWADNKDPGADASEKGNDLVEFDPTTMELTGRRVDLSKLNVDVKETTYDADFNPTGTAENPAFARPAALVAAGKFLVVGLVRVTDVYNYGAGLTAVVDPESGKLTDSIELAGTSNCGEVRPVQGSEDEVLVACLGAWGDGGAAAGLWKLAIDDDGKAKIVQKFLVSEHSGAANTSTHVVSLGGEVVVAVAPGSLDAESKVDVPDALYRVDLKSGKQTKLHESEGAYSLGILAYDQDTGVLLVPDAGDDAAPRYGVERFVVDEAGTIEHDGFVKVAPATTLAARDAHKL